MSTCPNCGQPVQVWADNSEGVAVNFACDNEACPERQAALRHHTTGDAAMSLSKQHYEAVAAIIRAEREAVESESHPVPRLWTVDRMTNRLCEYFAFDNPRFDPGRFRRACQP